MTIDTKTPQPPQNGVGLCATFNPADGSRNVMVQLTHNGVAQTPVFLPIEQAVAVREVLDECIALLRNNLKVVK